MDNGDYENLMWQGALFYFAESGQLVIILTCVIGGVVVIVALTMITLLCQKKTKKPVCKYLQLNLTK